MRVNVSVIVCCYGSAASTRRCLEALGAADLPERTEIILVDDASPEPVVGTGPAHLSVRVIRSPINEGFLATANRGASAASGEYIYFLNQDTQVRAGFLQHALALMKHRADAGCVVSKLIYPDGRLQEAGSELRADGSAANLGHGASPADYRFNHLRRVHYGSGAGLLVRRALFEELGGFDRAFAPAYYEDVDLQVRAAQRGWFTYYQPLSEVIHERGGSYGAQPGSASERLQTAHRKVLLERHGRWLAEQAPLRHLYLFDSIVPSRERSAGALRCFELLTLLARTFQVTLIPVAKAATPSEYQELTQCGVRVAQDVDAERPVPVARFLRENAAESVPCSIVARPEGGARALRLLREFHPNARVIYDTVDLTFRRCRSHLNQTSGDAAARALDELLQRRYRALETHLMRAADRVWMVTEEERAAALRLDLCPAEKMGVVPVVYTVSPSPASWRDRRDLLFFGGFSHRPNVDAIQHAVTQLLPLLAARGFPGRLLVAGADEDRVAHLRHPGLEVLGYVPDLTSLLNRARLAFFPLITGAGMKGKVAHALAAGLPVVTTPEGAAGYRDAENYMRIADTPAGLVAQVEALYADEASWCSQREAGLAYASAHLTRASVQAILDQELREINE